LPPPGALDMRAERRGRPAINRLRDDNLARVALCLAEAKFMTLPAPIDLMTGFIVEAEKVVNGKRMQLQSAKGRLMAGFLVEVEKMANGKRIRLQSAKERLRAAIDLTAGYIVEAEKTANGKRMQLKSARERLRAALRRVRAEP
jgi:hypothetical protein